MRNLCVWPFVVQQILFGRRKGKHNVHQRSLLCIKMFLCKLFALIYLVLFSSSFSKLLLAFERWTKPLLKQKLIDSNYFWWKLFLAAEAVLTTSLKWHVWSDMSACWYVSMSTYQHGSMSTCLKWHVSMLVCQHVHISAWQHVHISACQHVGMSACWYVSMSVNQQVGMSALWHVWKVKLSQFFHDLDMLYHFWVSS